MQAMHQRQAAAQVIAVVETQAVAAGTAVVAAEVATKAVAAVIATVLTAALLAAAYISSASGRARGIYRIPPPDIAHRLDIMGNCCSSYQIGAKGCWGTPPGSVRTC